MAALASIDVLDGSGIYGALWHYALFAALMGSAALFLINRWCKGRLDMDEEPKMRMMQDEEEQE